MNMKLNNKCVCCSKINWNFIAKSKRGGWTAWECGGCGYIQFYPAKSKNDMEKFFKLKYFQEYKQPYSFKVPPIFRLKYPWLRQSLIFFSRISSRIKSMKRVVFNERAPRPNHYVNLVLDYAHSLNDERVSLLDVGAGEFGHVVKFLYAGLDAWGLEPSNVARLLKEEYNAPVIHGDIESYVPDRKFDLITMRGVIQCLFDPITTFKKLAQMMKLNSYLIIEDGNPLFHDKKEIFISQFDPNYNVGAFQEKTIRKIASLAGLEVSRVFYLNQEKNVLFDSPTEDEIKESHHWIFVLKRVPEEMIINKKIGVG